jgi:hypothetical protein
MTLPNREARLLRRVDHALCRSDPDLASLLSIFARLNAAEAMPARSGWDLSRAGLGAGEGFKAFLPNGPWFHGSHPCASESRPGRGRDDDAAAGYSPAFSVVFSGSREMSR